MKNPTHYPLAVSRAAFAGDGVAKREFEDSSDRMETR